MVFCFLNLCNYVINNVGVDYYFLREGWLDNYFLNKFCKVKFGNKKLCEGSYWIKNCVKGFLLKRFCFFDVCI